MTNIESVLLDAGNQQIRQRREKSRIHKDRYNLTALTYRDAGMSNHPSTTLNTLRTVEINMQDDFTAPSVLPDGMTIIFTNIIFPPQTSERMVDGW